MIGRNLRCYVWLRDGIWKKYKKPQETILIKFELDDTVYIMKNTKCGIIVYSENVWMILNIGTLTCHLEIDHEPGQFSVKTTGNASQPDTLGWFYHWTWPVYRFRICFHVVSTAEQRSNPYPPEFMYTYIFQFRGMKIPSTIAVTILAQRFCLSNRRTNVETIMGNLRTT